jgi:hypothetical protein
MSISNLSRACFLWAALALSGVATGQEFAPVKEPQLSYLGITVQAPGTEGWVVAEQQYRKGWRVMYRIAESTEESRTSGVFLKADQYKPGKFAKEFTSLEALAQRVLRETRTPDNPQFTEKWAEVARADVHGTEAWRMRIAWEERNNPNFPGAEFLMEVVQVLMAHPQDPDRVLSIAATTRRRLDQEPLSADELAARFVGAMTFQ